MNPSCWGASPDDWFHMTVILGLAEDLLPVVSNPNATISEYSKISDLGKTPSLYNRDGKVVGFSQWTRNRSTDADITRWEAVRDYGICIQTREVRGLDVDITDADESAAVWAAIQRLAGALPRRTRANSPKFLCALRLPGEVGYRRVKTKGGVIEFLAHGKQFIAVGTHPSGLRYEWEAGLPDDIPTLSADEFEALWSSLVAEFGIEDPTVLRATRTGEGGEAVHDDVTEYLEANGWVKDIDRVGKVHITCPWEDQHTSQSETSTSYMPPGLGQFERGHFACLHAHCRGRSDDEFLDAVGYRAADFDIVELTDIEIAESEAAAAVNEAEIKAQSERFKLYDLADFSVGASYPYLIKTVLPAAELGVLFGESGSGKSFFAWDIAAHIARGEPWRGLRVRKGKVVYICAEGAQGFRKRVAAYCQHHQISPADMDMKVIADAPNFLTDADHKRVARRILEGWGQVDLIIVDTLAQTTPGANENAAEDMGKALGHLKALRRITGGMILLVHHSGKDASKGARGWSGLKAAADVEIEITRLDNCRVARLSKAKDDNDNIEFGFSLEVVNIGTDEDGDVISSCVAVPAEIDRTTASKTGRYLGAVQKLVMEVVGEIAQYQSQNIEVKFVIEGVVERMPKPESDKRDTRKQKARRAIIDLSTGDDAPLFVEGDVLSVV
jgi:RecA-family ATPase